MSGNAAIANFIKRLDRLATPELRARLAQKLGGVVIRLINEQIDRSVDPYGMPWKPRSDGAAPLKGLRGTFSARVVNGNPQVTSSKWYAVVHQRGWKIDAKSAPYLRFRLPNGQWVSKKTVIIPRRQLVPTERDGLSRSWNEALMKATEQFYRDHLQGRG